MVPLQQRVSIVSSFPKPPLQTCGARNTRPIGVRRATATLNRFTSAKMTLIVEV